MVLTEMISFNFEGMVVLKWPFFLTVSTLGGCGGIERMDL